MSDADLHCTEGIILHVVPYRNYDQILTVFTLNHGVIKLFCKKGKASWQRHTPLTKVEVVFRVKKSELFACDEISPCGSYLNLRNHLNHLQTGCELIRTVYLSQLVGKEAPLLYQLLLYYLDKIPEVLDPQVLLASFKLKLLKHEGLLSIGPFLQPTYQLSEDDLDVFFVLAHSQSYNQLAQLTLDPILKEKIDQFFLKSIQQ